LRLVSRYGGADTSRSGLTERPRRQGDFQLCRNSKFRPSRFGG